MCIRTDTELACTQCTPVMHYYAFKLFSSCISDATYIILRLVITQVFTFLNDDCQRNYNQLTISCSRQKLIYHKHFCKKGIIFANQQNIYIISIFVRNYFCKSTKYFTMMYHIKLELDLHRRIWEFI